MRKEKEKMKYLKIFEEFTQQTANLQKVKITSSDSHGEIIMIGHILKKEDNFKDDQYFFIPEEDGFKSIEKEHMPYIDSLRKKFNDSIGKKLLIDAGDYQSIKFGRMGRVNSFITGKGGARKADADLWVKAKAAKERKKKNK